MPLSLTGTQENRVVSALSNEDHPSYTPFTLPYDMTFEFNSMDQMIRTLEALGIEDYSLEDRLDEEIYGTDSDQPYYFPAHSDWESFDSYSTFDSNDFEYQQSLCV